MSYVKEKIIKMNAIQLYIVDIFALTSLILLVTSNIERFIHPIFWMLETFTSKYLWHLK